MPAEASALFRLGSINNSKVKDVLHQIQTYGMEDPRYTHQLLSLFQPEEFTDDPFHVLSSNPKPQTLWDQVVETASNERNLTGDQKVVIMLIKRLALQSLAEDQQGNQRCILDQAVRDAAQTELQDYDAYSAKILDPDDPASARFFDRTKVVGKIAGKAAKAGGTAYLMLNLVGCFGVGPTPSPDVSLPPATPEVMATLSTPESPFSALTTAEADSVVLRWKGTTLVTQTGVSLNIIGDPKLYYDDPNEKNLQRQLVVLSPIKNGIPDSSIQVALASADVSTFTGDVKGLLNFIVLRENNTTIALLAQKDETLSKDGIVTVYKLGTLKQGVDGPSIQDTGRQFYVYANRTSLPALVDGTTITPLVPDRSYQKFNQDYNPFLLQGSLALVPLMWGAQLLPREASATPSVAPATPTLKPSPPPTETAPPSTEAPPPTEVYQPRQVELVFAPDGTTLPDSCKVIPEATADNTLTLNGQPLPDGTVIDSYQAMVSMQLGKYHQPTLLITARAVAIEKLDTVQFGGKPVDRYLLCYNIKLPSGDNMVLASVFENTTDPGFENTFVCKLPGTDVAGVTLDQTVANRTPYKGMRNSDFIALFTSGKIIGQEVLLPFVYDYPNSDKSPYDELDAENPWRAAIVDALKAGQLPQPVHLNPLLHNAIGVGLVVPASLVP